MNRDKTENKLNREFAGRERLEAVVSDLTYVDVRGKWLYICLIIELSHREIIGFAAGKNKNAELVEAMFLSIKEDLRKVSIFHADRGGEFKNDLIERKLAAFGIEQSLSRPGTPLDNAVAESMYDILKTEFVFGETFDSLDDLQSKLTDWVRWYNCERSHGSLGFISPCESKAIRAVGVSKPAEKERCAVVAARSVNPV